MAKSRFKPTRTSIPGIYFIVGTAVATDRPEKIYYVSYYRHSKRHFEKTAFRESRTPVSRRHDPGAGGGDPDGSHPREGAPEQGAARVRAGGYGGGGWALDDRAAMDGIRRATIPRQGRLHGPGELRKPPQRTIRGEGTFRARAAGRGPPPRQVLEDALPRRDREQGAFRKARGGGMLCGVRKTNDAMRGYGIGSGPLTGRTIRNPNQLKTQLQQLPEIRDGGDQTLPQGDGGLPPQLLLRQGDVRAAADRVVLGKRTEDDLGLRPGELLHHRRQLEDAELLGVAHVHRPHDLVLVHHRHHAPDEVVHIAERARLAPRAKEGDRLSFQRLDDEVGDYAAVVGVHPGAVSVEDADHADLQLVLAVIVEEEGLRAPLPLVIACPGSDGVHVPPVRLPLRVFRRAAIHLGGGGLKDAHLQALGQAQHVDGAVHAGLRRLHGVELVVDRRGGAREVVDLADLDVEGPGDVVAHQIEHRVSE